MQNKDKSNNINKFNSIEINVNEKFENYIKSLWEINSQKQDDVLDKNSILLDEKIENTKSYINSCDKTIKENNEVSINYLRNRSRKINNKITEINEIYKNNDFTNPNDIKKIEELMYCKYKLESLHRDFHNIYFSKVIEKIDKKFTEIDKKTNGSKKEIEKQKENMSELLSESKKDINNLSNKVEGLGATFLTTIVTFSFVTSMIAICLRINVVYFPLLLIGMLWILLSILLFIGSMFKRYDNSFKDISFWITIIVYIVISILGIFVYCKTKDYFNESKKDKKIIEKCLEKENYIKDNEDKIKDILPDLLN